MNTYKVVFWGETCPGKSKEAAMIAFADRFGIKCGKQLRSLFSGQTNTLKHGLDRTYARRLALAIEEIGCRSRIECERTSSRGTYETAPDKGIQLSYAVIPSTYPQGLDKKLAQALAKDPKRLSINLGQNRSRSSF
jgi:hypothetical protein